jgi:tetratricopeptide (TPR) repeat protein
LLEALRLRPDYFNARINLGAVLSASGDLDAATVQYREALRLDPRSAEAHYNFGNVLAQRGTFQDAIDHYREAVRLKPDYEAAQDMLQRALERQGG